MRQPIRIPLSRWLLSAAVIALALSTARPALANPHSPELLRTRVSEELVREGVSLATLERTLVVETRGEGVLVRITDRRTGAVIAERTVARLPPDREAAIAHLTMLVAGLLKAEDLKATDAAALLTGWRAAFVAQTVAAHHRPASIAVLAGGDRRGEAGAAVLSAADALAAAYREAGIGLVAGGEGLGDLAGLDDEAIVKRAASLPVATIAVVRVFTGGAKPRAVVSLYDKTGALVTAYTATIGEPVRATEQEAGPVEGISSRALDTVLKEHDQVGKTRREYQRRVVSTSWTAVGNGDESLRGKPIFFVGMGEEKREVSGADFYTSVGRDDLASSYRRRRVGGLVAFWGGLGIMASSFLLLESPDFCIDEIGEPEYDACRDREKEEEDRGMKRAFTVLGVGAVVGLVGTYFAFKPHPVDENERQGLVRSHNVKLRKELGMPDEDDSGEDRDGDPKPPVSRTPAPTSASPSFALAPFVTHNGGGIDVLFRF
jgi:hypothetical protein